MIIRKLATFAIALVLQIHIGATYLRAQTLRGVEIVVIGTVHNPTTKFTEATLVTILQRVKPDLILLELDPSFFDGSFALVEKYQNISMENRAILTYAKSVSVKLRPFDIEGRNKFYQEQDYFKRELNLNQEIGRMHAAGQLSANASMLFEGLRAFAALRDSCGADRPEVINSAACDTAIEKKQEYAFKGIAKIVDHTPALKEFKAFVTLADDFWIRRNEAMVRNILKHSNELRPTRVVVLCGYEHRYYLRSRLTQQMAQEGFTLKEYLDY